MKASSDANAIGEEIGFISKEAKVVYSCLLLVLDFIDLKQKSNCLHLFTLYLYYNTCTFNRHDWYWQTAYPMFLVAQNCIEYL